MDVAREALEGGRYVDAVKACRAVLKQDRNNYEGFVLLGMALVRSRQHLDQADMSFRKAISLNPAALPAYQGLVELREAEEIHPEQIVESYEALVNVAKTAGESALATEFMRKCAVSHTKSHSYERAKAAWQELLLNDLNDEQRIEALSGLVDSEVAIMERNIQEYQRQASAKFVNRETINPEDLLRLAETAWSKTESSKSLESHLRDLLLLKLPQPERYQELLLRVLLYRLRASTDEEKQVAVQQLFIHSMSMLSASPSELVLDVLLAIAEEDDAEELFSGSEVGEAGFSFWLGKHAAHLYSGKEIAKASREELAQWDISRDEHSISGWRTLAKQQFSSGLLDKAFESANKGLSAVALKRKSYGLKLKAAEQELRLLVANILMMRENHNEASRIFLSVTEESKHLSQHRRIAIIGEAFQGLVKLSLATKQTEVAKSRLDQILAQDPENHWALSERGWLEYEARSLNQAKDDLEKAVSTCQDSAVYHYRLGRIYWEIDGMKQNAMSEFLESAKLDPGQPKPFLYLGHYYKEHGKDIRRAIRCYQKVVLLDSENESTGEMLCDMLDNGGQYVLERNTCEGAMKKSPRAFWAWRRLGLIQAAEKRWSEAVGSTQYALRGYPADARLWEALALSYKNLGMFSAALKAFGRAFDLDNSSLFAALGIGAIQLVLSSFAKAIHSYRQALRILPGDLNASYGLATALIGQARESLSLGAFLWSATLSKEAMDLATKNRILYGHLVACWKQLGDASLLYAQALPFDAALNSNTAEVSAERLRDAVKKWEDERVNAASNAIHAYKYALHLQPNEGSSYSDLAIAMEYFSTLKKSKTSSQWSEAEAIACSSLQLDGSNADLWVTLGLVAQHKGLQQHAFIQALRLDANHTTAWAYLGQLHLRLNHPKLAQQYFDRARSADSSLALTWVGMAAVHNFSEREDELLEAFANCSCAVQLSSAVDFHEGFGQLAARTQALSSPQVNAALRHAVQRGPLRAATHNLKGLSSEARMDFTSAILVYRIARAAAFLSSESTRRQDCITSNLARALCKAGDAEAAVLEYDKLFRGGLTTLGDVRGYAIALKNSGQAHQAEVIVKRAMEGIKQKAQFSAMLILLAKLTYFSQGAVPALNVLLGAPESLFLEKEFCLTTLALGVCTSKSASVSAAVQRCRLTLDSDYAPNAYVLLASGNQNGVVRNWIKVLHMHPQNESLRAKLAQMILSQSRGFKSTLVERLCHHNSITSDCELTKRLSSIVLTDATLASGFNSVGGTDALAELRRLVHKEPHNVEAWYCLTLFLLQAARRQDFPQHLCRTVSRISESLLARLSYSYNQTYMRGQLELCISECKLRDGDYASALDHAKAALTVSKAFPEINLAALLQLARCYAARNDFSSAKIAVSGWNRLRSSENSLWQVFLMELELGLQTRAEENISRFRQDAEARWLALLEIVLAGFYVRKGDIERSEDLASKALSFWPNNPVLNLFHGAVCIELVKSGTTGFLSKAISSLAKAVNGKQDMDVPLACALLAQAESNRDSTRSSSLRKWANNIRREFLTWPGDFPVPAEIYFQMALLAKQEYVSQESECCPESSRGWRSWLQLALHLNPACSRYWTLSKQVK